MITEKVLKNSKFKNKSHKSYIFMILWVIVIILSKDVEKMPYLLSKTLQIFFYSMYYDDMK